MCRYQQMDTRLLRFSHKSYVTLIQMIIVWYFRLMMTSIKNAQNLHKQFGHASSNNLKNLFKKAELFSTEISKLINENCDNCVVCKTHKKPPPRPMLGYKKQKHSITLLQWIFIVSVKIFGTFILLRNSPELAIPPLLKAKTLLSLLRMFFKTGSVLLAVHQKYLAIMRESFLLKSSQTSAK